MSGEESIEEEEVSIRCLRIYLLCARVGLYSKIQGASALTMSLGNPPDHRQYPIPTRSPFRYIFRNTLRPFAVIDADSSC